MAPQPRTSTAAVWSLVLGILSMFCLWLLGSIPAIILGIMALSKINAQPTALAGRGLAISGIVTGSIGILTGLVAVGIFASLAMPAYNVAQDRAESTKQTHEIRILVMACLSYAEENEGKFPESLRQLYPSYIDNEVAFTASGTEGESYLYRAEAVEPKAGEPLVLLPPGENRKQIIGYADGSVVQTTDPLPPDILAEFE